MASVSPGSEVYVGISASSIFSTEDVRLLTPSARNCRYSYENHLNYFSRYSQSNCFMERMAKTITRQCGCLPFYFLGYFRSLSNNIQQILVVKKYNDMLIFPPSR